MIAFDVALRVGCVLLAAFWAGQERQESPVTYAVVFALVMVVFNAWLGLYGHSILDGRYGAYWSGRMVNRLA